MVRIPLLVVFDRARRDVARGLRRLRAGQPGPMRRRRRSPAKLRQWRATGRDRCGRATHRPIYKQGSAAIDLTIAPDGTWTGTIGPDQASGVARWHGKRLLLTGTLQRAGGRYEEPVYLDLVGDDTRRWSETHAFFGERESPASASLRKVL